MNDLRFSDLLADCANLFSACLNHNWGTALPGELSDILQHNYRAPSCETAQQRIDGIIYGPAGPHTQFAAYENWHAILDANADCNTKNWGHSFEYIKDRLKHEGVRVAQTYMTTYPADIFDSSGPASH